MKFSKKLQIMRKEKGLSQENLAESVGVSRQAVAKWEAGQSYPDIEKLVVISDLFKVTIDRLVREFDDDCCFCEEERREYLYNEDLVNFLLRAKRACYAGKGVESNSSRPKSHDLYYTEGSLNYIDSYVGGEKFAGEEVIWIDGVPYWSMNYFGRVLKGTFSGDFLKETLLLVSKERPYRGPLVYQNGDYKYHCIINGEFDWFNGYEEIFYTNEKIYECVFHGGILK